MSIGGWLAFTLYFGAAVHDATPEQRAALHARFHFHAENLRSDDPEVWRPAWASFAYSIQSIMGEEWQPIGEWAEQIERMIGKGDAIQKRETT